MGHIRGRLLWPKAIPLKMRFHELRDTTATLLLRAGVDAHRVQRLLRHRDVRTTTTIYGHLDVEDLRAALAKLPELGPNWVQGLSSKHFPAPGSQVALLSVGQVAQLLCVSTALVYPLLRTRRVAPLSYRPCHPDPPAGSGGAIGGRRKQC